MIVVLCSAPGAMPAGAGRLDRDAVTHLEIIDLRCLGTDLGHGSRQFMSHDDRVKVKRRFPRKNLRIRSADRSNPGFDQDLIWLRRGQFKFLDLHTPRGFKDHSFCLHGWTSALAHSDSMKNLTRIQISQYRTTPSRSGVTIGSNREKR